MKIKNLLFAATFTIGFLTLFSSCQSAIKMVERGNYDQAITYTVKKIAGKKKKKEKFVSPLADAFNRANARDLQAIKNLKRNGNPESWDKIATLYRNIQNRQNKVVPLMPIYDENGYEASLNMVEVSNFIEESKKKAAEYHYVLAKKLLTDAANGDRFAAREAYDRLEKTEQYYRNYKDKSTLQKQALALGTTYVLLTMKNSSRTVLPRNFEREITNLTTRDMDSRWKVYHAQPKTDLTYDYKVVMNLRDIVVSPSLVKEREYIDDKEIEDGWDYVLDNNGNVLKDTLGNDVKVPRKVIIKARVLETFQQKEARVAGVLEFYDNHTKDVIRRENITADAIFENYASTFRGDRRALSANSKKRIGNQPLPFPTDVELLLNAADVLKPSIKGKIVGARVIL